MRHLPCGMDPGIGAPGGSNLMWAHRNFGQSGLNRPLHRAAIILALPPRERRTVIFNFKGKSRHILALKAK
jgi:hypothetical protein